MAVTVALWEPADRVDIGIVKSKLGARLCVYYIGLGTIIQGELNCA